jgi:hypothetical protein
MEIHKPGEKEKGISERGNDMARMGRVFHETMGREKARRKTKTQMKEKQTAPEEKEKSTEEGRSAECMEPKE